MKKGGPVKRAGSLHRADFTLRLMAKGLAFSPVVDTGLYIKLLQKLKTQPG